MRFLTSNPFHLHSCVATSLVALWIGVPAPARAADQNSELATQLLNEVRQRVASCADQARTPGLPVSTIKRPLLAWNPQLAQAAEQHSRSMADQAFFDHRGLDGGRVSDRADAAGYRWRAIAENLAAGYRSLEEALRGWLRSEGHCRNLLDERYSEFGLAKVESNRAHDRYRIYWTLVLGRPANTLTRDLTTGN